MAKIQVDTIIFDFDSTVMRGELLELIAEKKLANHPLKKILLERIKDITNQGMEGKISFYESLSRRLQLLNLDEATLNDIVPQARSLINPEYLELMLSLADKKNIYIISGGYSNILHQISDDLLLPSDKIYAVKLHFSQGVFSHLDPNDPLIQSDGKARVAKSLLAKGKTLMVGDGMTDYQVKALGGADYFAAYIGVAERLGVVEKADFVLKNLLNLNFLIE